MAGDSKSIVAAVAEVKDLKDAIGDLKKEIDEALSALNNFGRVGSLSVRNLGSEARSLQSTFRDLSRELRRVSTPSGTIGAAATSQALGALTAGGGGGGGVGGGGGGGPRIGAGGIGGLVGGAVGTIGSAASMILGGAASKIPYIGGALGASITGAGKILSRGASVVATTGLQGGVGFLENAMSRQMGLEQQGRSYLGWTGMLPTPESPNVNLKEWWKRAQQGSGAKLPTAAMQRGAAFGFNASEMIKSTLPLLPLAGPGRGGRRELENFVSGTMLPFGTGAGLGTGAGPIRDFTAAMRSGGRSFGDVGQVLGGALGRFGQGDARQSISLLSSIKGAIGTLIQVTGRATQGQVQGAANLHRGLSKLGKFAPEVTPGLANMLHKGGISPGGGAPGMVAMLQTMGFGMPDLGRQQSLASQMGIGETGRFGQKRGYLEAMLAMQKQDPAQAAESLLLTARRIGGVQPMHQAHVMTQLVPGLKLPTALDLVQSEGLERKTLLAEVGKTFKEGGEKIELPTTKELKAQTSLLEEYHKMVNMTLGVNRKELAKIAEALTKVKVALVGPTSAMLLKLPDTIDTIFDKIMKGLEKMGLVVASGSSKGSSVGGPRVMGGGSKPSKTAPKASTLAILRKGFNDILNALGGP